MQCRQHRLRITHICLDASCDMKIMCQRCRLDHRNAHQSNKDEETLDQVKHRCRQRLSNQLKSLKNAFMNIEQQREAAIAIEKCKQKLDKQMREKIDQVMLQFSGLKAQLDIKNKRLVQIAKHQALIRRVVDTRNRINAMMESLQNVQDLRYAMKLETSDLEESLVKLKLTPVNQYWICDPKYSPVVHVNNPEFVMQSIAKHQGKLQARTVPSKTQQFYIITEPQNYKQQSDTLFFFQPNNVGLHTFHLKEAVWHTHQPPEELPQDGDAIYDPLSKTYFYMGGNTRKNNRKSVVSYNSNTSQWSKNREMFVSRSSSSSCLIPSKQENKNLIMVVGGFSNEAIKDCQIYDPQGIESSQIAPLNFAAYHACLCKWTDSVVFKFGGLANSKVGQICQIIQKYDRSTDTWAVLNVDLHIRDSPIKNHLNHLFFAKSCAVKINDSEIFLFGGYSSGLEGVSESFIFNVQKPTPKTFRYTIRFRNQKPLPYKAGFSMTKPTYFGKSIYVLQDIQKNNREIEHQRNILEFDGYQWRIYSRVYPQKPQI